MLLAKETILNGNYNSAFWQLMKMMLGLINSVVTVWYQLTNAVKTNVVLGQIFTLVLTKESS